MDKLISDVRYSLRTLARSPGFTSVAVLALALGIGANTAIFSVLNAVLLRPLPYPAPDELVKVWTHFTGIGMPNDRNWVSVPEFVDLRTLNRSFSNVAALTPDTFNISTGALPERVEGAKVSVGFFRRSPSPQRSWPRGPVARTSTRCWRGSSRAFRSSRPAPTWRR